MKTIQETNGSTAATGNGMTTGIQPWKNEETTADETAHLTPIHVACAKLRMTPEALEALCRYRHIDINESNGKRMVDLQRMRSVSEHIVEHFRQVGLAWWSAIVQGHLESYGVRLRKAQALQVTTRYCYESWDDEDEAFELKISDPVDVVERFLWANGIVATWIPDAE